MSLIVVVSVISVTLPSVWFYYQSAKQALLQSELIKLTMQTQKAIAYDELLLKLAEPKLTALSRLLAKQSEQPVTKETGDLFADKIMQFEDGAWRNRQQYYNGRQQTGLFLPSDILLTEQNKQFYLSALGIFDVFGASTTTNPIFNNVWMLGHDRSELIFNLSHPDFVYLMAEDTDYTNTPWMRLASPEDNPDRVLKWTPALFDPVPEAWIVSAVYPLDIAGEWRATLGMDINVNELVELFYLQNDEHPQQQHFLLTADDDFILAGQWQDSLMNNPGALKLNLDEQGLLDMFMGEPTVSAGVLAPVTIEGQEYQVVASMIQPMAWRYYRLVPTKDILHSLHNTILKTSLLILLTVMLLGILIHAAVKRLMVWPLIMMAARANAYVNDRLLPVFTIKNNDDEIGDLNHALQSMYDELALEKKQLLDSEQRYRRVVTHIREIIVQIDSAGMLRFLSPVWKQMTGYGLQQSINQPVKQFTHPAEQHLVERMLTDLANNTIQTWLGEVRLLTAEHGFVWVNMSLQRTIESHHPDEYLIVGTIENIQNERLERAVNHTLRTAEQMVLAADCKHDALLEFLCKEMAYVLGMPLFWIKVTKNKNMGLFHAGERENFLLDVKGVWPGLEDVDAHVSTKFTKDKLIRLNKVDNQPESWRQRLLNDEFYDGVLVPFNLGNSNSGIIGVHSAYREECDEAFQNIMLLFVSGLRVLCKLTEDQNLMRLHRAAVENTANSIMIMSADSTIEWVNEAFVHLTLFQVDEVIGYTPKILKGSVNKQGYTQEIWQTISSGNTWQGEQENYRKDGQSLDVYQTITPLMDNQGSITHFIAVMEDITVRKANEERIAFMATHDELTDLPNRNLLHDRLEQAISFTARSNTKMAVMFIDIDHFKFINDSLGHQVGDELLQVLAKRFTGALRKGDTVARFGGDEFVVILPEIVALENINNITHNLLQAIQLPYNIAGHELMVTGSLGISVYPDDSENADDLIQHADSAMYLAKQQGRNNSQFYTPKINERINRRVTLEKALRQALEQEQFVVFYQPKIDLVTHRMTGMEALVRWQHPELGLVSPLEFIPLAEETGIILALGEWVMLTACRQMHDWELKYSNLMNMSINVSARQFWQHDFTERVAVILAESQVSAEKIEFELTESVVMNDIESVIGTMKALKKLDICLSIDDFGTGYSSLSYLQRFPVDILKIDRCFITELQDENADSAMVRSILALAENFKLRVVAEGIEDVSQQRILTSLGCHYGQGYLYSQPVDAASMEKLLMLDKGCSSHFSRQ
tara:strand:+ start:43921 stop:47745 length:3825 start_codon:yes stop_codon:yes gene_type:complete